MKNLYSDIDKNKTFTEVFELNPNDFKDINILLFDFDCVMIKELTRNNIFYLNELLLKSSRDLLNIRNIGEIRLNKCLNFFYDLQRGKIDIIPYRISSMHNVPLKIAQNREKILEGTFDYEDIDISNKVKHKYIEARRILEKELTEMCIYEPNQIVPLINSLNRFTIKQNIVNNKRKYLAGLTYCVSNKRNANRVFDYINLYPTNISNRRILRKVFKGGFDLSNDEMATLVNNDKRYKTTLDFLQWLCISNEYYIKKLFRKINANSLRKRIIDLSCSDYSLFEISHILKYPLEKIISKHNQLIDEFFADNDSLAVFLLLSLDRNKNSFNESELKEEFGNLATKIKYMYSQSTNANIIFDKSLNQIILK